MPLVDVRTELNKIMLTIAAREMSRGNEVDELLSASVITRNYLTNMVEYKVNGIYKTENLHRHQLLVNNSYNILSKIIFIR